MKRILKLINHIYDSLMSFGVSTLLARQELGSIIKVSGRNMNCKNLDDWVTKWKVLGRVNKDYYRVFSQYCGEDVNIVPDDICHNVIEPILNPKRFLSLYEDKCLFDRLLWYSFGKNVTPYTYIKNIDGFNWDTNYSPVDSIDQVISEIPAEIDRLIVKKSIDSSSGKGVVFFQRDIDGLFKEVSTKYPLSNDYLKRFFLENYVVQKVMKQSAFMSQFCKTSVNTIRIAVYNSVKTNKPCVISAIIRIGQDGSLVDNAHAGGMFVGVNSNGILGKFCCNQYGEKKQVFNGIDFDKQEFKIPNYEKVKVFAEKVAGAMYHQRLIALDIMLDDKDEPVLIEYNIRAFGIWAFQFTNGSGFGKYTDEVIEYCREHIDEATRIFVTF